MLLAVAVLYAQQLCVVSCCSCSVLAAGHILQRHCHPLHLLLLAGKKYVAEYVNDCPSCGSFFDLGDDDVEPPPSQQLRGTIAAGTLRQHLASQQPPSQLPVLQLSQPSKVSQQPGSSLV